MRLPTFRRLFKGDYKPDFQSLVEQLSVTINNGFEVVYDALNRKLTLRDNVFCTVKEFEVEADVLGIPKAQIRVTFDVPGKVEGVQVLNIVNLSNTASYTIGAPFVHYEALDNAINVVKITGLIPNNKYRIKLVIYQN